jgi:hypothetical protein
MKKFAVLTLAALMLAAFTMPAWAMETEFGGFWRTRAWTQQNFTGEDESEAEDIMAVDTRTHLYFTTIFHENLKFVNKFEFDAVWGDVTDSYGDIGTDGLNVEIKHSYADFNLGPVNFKVGAQGYIFGRSFLFDADFAGAVVAFNSDTISIPVVWIKAYEGRESYERFKDAGRSIKEINDYDVDYFGVNPSIAISDMITINPFFLYVYSEGFSEYSDALPNVDDINLWYAGMNLDANFNAASLWLTGIYQGGDVDLGGPDAVDFKAWLAAGGFSVNLPFGDVHGQAFYATGEDAEEEDIEKFFVPAGQTYYWGEIMGYGTFGDLSYANVSNNSPADQIGNIMAANLGVTIKPMPQLTIALDVWYAALAEDIDGDKYKTGMQEENYLGTEIDLRITYQLVQGLNLDIVGAYLFAGDVTTMNSKNEADPYEVGSMLSLTF